MPLRGGALTGAAAGGAQGQRRGGSTVAEGPRPVARRPVDDREVLVGVAVAVVVQPVADLVSVGVAAAVEVGRAARHVLKAGDQAVGALALALAGLAQGQLLEGQAFVHLPVAVVVDGVADLLKVLGVRPVGVGGADRRGPSRPTDDGAGPASAGPVARAAQGDGVGGRGAGPRPSVDVVADASADD